jgi:YbbR domain-containing protein
MNLITDDWRLKLLAVGLAILMLGAVAFSQNPPTTRTLQVGINYTVPPDLILINPPTKASVTYSGLADVLASVTPDNLVALVDATHASPGPDIKLNVTAKSLINGVIVQNPPPIAVNIDAKSAVALPVTVIAHAAPGWVVTKADALCPASPCVVHFTGPKTWEVSLRATVVFPDPVNVVGPIERPNQTIQLVTNNGTLDQSCRTVPCASLDVPAVSIRIEGQTGSTSNTVALVDAPPANPPPAGYRVVGITISPVTVIITGDAVTLGKIQRITLPAVDLSSKTSNYTVQATIPYPVGVSGSVATASITYQIAANPNVSPSP